ncbi:MAG: hypothetical protein WKF67_07970 [Rubrobacteraceae bacterium]
MDNEINETRFDNVLSKSIKEELRMAGWPVYKNYEISEDEGQVFVTAPLSVSSVPEEDPTSAWRGYNRIEIGNTDIDAKRIYAPLRTPELVVDLAYLAEKEITAEVVLRWAKNYGLLGHPEDDVVELETEFGNYRHRGQGRRDSVDRFASVAAEVMTCLRAFEAATAGEGPLDLDALDAVSGPLPIRARRPWERRAGEERRWVLKVVGRMVQMRVNEHCYLKLSHYSDGRFVLNPGFKNLLGAVWLQMAWLLESGDRARTCKLRDCFRVIAFESGEQASLDAPRGTRGQYRTRKDKQFCSHNCAAKYSYRKKRGWPGYG